MKLGVVSDSHYLVTPPEHEYALHSFTISTDSMSFSKLFHSAFATPARYVQEIFLRLRALDKEGERSKIFVFNPLFSSGRLDILLVIAALKDAMPFEGVTIFTDKDGLPAGYLFPPWLDTKDARYLILLSTVDGEVDATLCRLLFQTETRCLQVPYLSLARAQNNGFIYKENWNTYLWVAERAIAQLSTNPSRSDVPFTAIMPHHAGDVLFFVLAFKRTQTLINHIAVNHAYRDIVEDNVPELAVIPINATLINRGEEFRQGEVTPEGPYFHSIKNELPENGFYAYFRPSRDYNVSNFHLIDHFAFALGRRLCSEKDLPSRAFGPPLFQPNTPADAPIRVLLHFDGGWPLKVYPKPYQERLIELLRANNYAVTVLAASELDYINCTTTTFKNYFQFKTLLQNQHLMVGMDSFPAHYATHVLGLPTLCLFASTRPENSDAPGSSNYAKLEAGLSCRPCYGIARCPLYGVPYCRNFVSPETVVARVDDMVAGNSRKELGGELRGSFAEAEEFCQPNPEELPTQLKRISISHIRLKATLSWAISPYLNYLALLYKEFSATVRTDGFLLATLRTIRFLRRAIRRLTTHA